MNTPSKKHVPQQNIPLGKAFKEIGRNAYVDWIIIIFISVFVTLVLVGGGIYLYKAITTGDIQGLPHSDGTAAKSFDRSELSGLIQDVNDHQEASDKAKSGYSGIADPSQ